MAPNHPLNHGAHPLTPEQLGEQRTIVMGDRPASCPPPRGKRWGRTSWSMTRHTKSAYCSAARGSATCRDTPRVPT
ncbi:hypothetical protein O0544_14065 [Edwardsiella anguillarum]|nr:hypothetical protein [Edwardsiella anguillarum]